MDDCGSEKTICYEEDGWSVTLTRYVSMELGETVASWLSFRTGGIFIRTMPMPSSRKMGRRRICNA